MIAQRVQQTADRALRRVVAYGANRIASSERLMSLIYDDMNETSFG